MYAAACGLGENAGAMREKQQGPTGEEFRGTRCAAAARAGTDADRAEPANQREQRGAGIKAADQRSRIRSFRMRARRN